MEEWETDEAYCVVTFCPRRGPNYSKVADEPLHLCDRHANALGLTHE